MITLSDALTAAPLAAPTRAPEAVGTEPRAGSAAQRDALRPRSNSVASRHDRQSWVLNYRTRSYGPTFRIALARGLNWRPLHEMRVDWTGGVG